LSEIDFLFKNSFEFFAFKAIITTMNDKYLEFKARKNQIIINNK